MGWFSRKPDYTPGHPAGTPTGHMQVLGGKPRGRSEQAGKSTQRQQAAQPRPAGRTRR